MRAHAETTFRTDSLLEQRRRAGNDCSNIKPVAILAFVLASLITELAAAQRESSPGHAPEITVHNSTHLVLVDVTALTHGLPDNTLNRDDFQLFDNERPVSIKTFDSGAESTTRPLALWFMVQCNMQGWLKEGSALFSGQVNRLKPALKFVDEKDSLAVAHWCDNGDSRVDLLPTKDVEEATTTLEQVLAPAPDAGPTGRPGELALQKTLQLIVDATRSLVPQPVPVVIFLYGDYSAMPRSEADHFIDELLETSAIAYGLKDRRSPTPWFILDEQKAIAHYISRQTGGQYLTVTPEGYEAGLEEILKQLHFRYELGFKPEALDGKRHKLRVTLSRAAARQHKQMRLRYRAAYVPVQAVN